METLRIFFQLPCALGCSLVDGHSKVESERTRRAVDRQHWHERGDSNKSVHLFLFGFSSFGRRLKDAVADEFRSSAAVVGRIVCLRWPLVAAEPSRTEPPRRTSTEAI